MTQHSTEMSAEEMTEAMSLAEAPDASNSALAAKSKELTLEINNSESAKVENLQESPGEAASLDKPAPEEENTVDTNAAKSLAENMNPTKFSDKDALDLIPYIEKYVKVHLVKDYSYIGFVHSIDPLTHSVILSVPKKDKIFQTVIIPGASVLDVIEVPQDSNILPPERKPVQKIVTDDDQTRKKKLMSWLKENHLQVTEEGDNIVFSGITVLPPYEEKDICTTNPLIALEIRKVIDRMPADYQPK